MKERLPIVGGFAAILPPPAVPRLARSTAVLAVSADRKVTIDTTSDPSPSPSALRSVYPKVVRADDTWAAGTTGRGVTVAVVDTGISSVADLAGRILPVTDEATGTTAPCVNLSGEDGCSDSYGHGTFIAGVIAGSGASSSGAWKGVAPDARLVSIKIAGRDGSADVSNVLSAIQWAVSFKDRYGIGVLNLSLGTDSTESYRQDPLNYAVERAWAAGITVVVSASNRGPAARSISKPGDDPWVITVGATDDRETPGLGDDELPNFTSRGPTATDGLAKPDVVAPGAHVISLRAPGSAIDTEFPYYIDEAYRRGSGTSMASAVVSGVVALMLDADESMTPDRVKHALTATARSAASTDPMAVGAGVVNAYDAAFAAPAGTANGGQTRSSGLGGLDASRGNVGTRADDPAGTVVTGALTAQLLLWDAPGYTGSDWVPSTWYSSTWQIAPLYRLTWDGNNWQGNNWQGASWYGVDDPTRWYGNNWQGSEWYGAWR